MEQMLEKMNGKLEMERKGGKEEKENVKREFQWEEQWNKERGTRSVVRIAVRTRRERGKGEQLQEVQEEQKKSRKKEEVQG